MTATYFGSDWHINHDNICNFREQFTTVQEHNEFIFDNYCSVVRPKDHVYLLGDMAFDKAALELIKKLPGIKHLVMGNHCYTEEHELLTTTGFKVIKEINNLDEIATVDLQTNLITFEKPSKIIVNNNSNLYAIQHPWINCIVSEGHNIVIDNNLKIVSDCVGEYNFNRFKLSALNTKQDGLKEDLNWLKLIVQVVCDSTLVRSSINKCRVQFKLSKQRKIDRLRELLNSLNIPFTFKECKKTSINVLQPYYIRIYGQYARNIFNYLNNIKQFPTNWINCNKEEITAILEEISITDGYIDHNKINWTSTNFNDIDIIQTSCVKNNINFKYDTVNNLSGFNSTSIQYKAVISLNSNNKSTVKVKIFPTGESGITYGVTVSKDTVIVRYKGKVWVSGNCKEKKRDITLQDLVDTYHDIHGFIRYKEFWLSHCPIAEQELRGHISVHGHVHFQTISSNQYLNVCLENTNYKPVSLETLRKCIQEGKIYDLNN